MRLQVRRDERSPQDLVFYNKGGDPMFALYPGTEGELAEQTASQRMSNSFFGNVLLGLGGAAVAGGLVSLAVNGTSDRD